ncbi:35630_t:CDS:2, partial [Gigaspora margarita]
DKLQKDCRIQDLKKLLFGTLYKEAIKTRCLYMRDLFDRLIFNQLNQRKRYKEMIEWEENTEIRKALKKKVLGRTGEESMNHKLAIYKLVVKRL